MAVRRTRLCGGRRQTRTAKPFTGTIEQKLRRGLARQEKFPTHPRSLGSLGGPDLCRALPAAAKPDFFSRHLRAFCPVGRLADLRRRDAGAGFAGLAGPSTVNYLQ